MYTLVSAYGVGKKYDSTWKIVDVKDYLVYDLFKNFRKLYLTLSSPYLKENINVDLEIFRSEYGNYDKTLKDLFNEIGNRSLQTTSYIPLYETKYAQFSDVFSQGYKVEVNVPGQPPDERSKRDEKTELCIKRDRTNPKTIFEHCLVTLNGYFYPTDYDKNYTYVLNGGKSLLRSRRNQIGILSFQDICKIKQIPLTVDLIEKTKEDIPYFNEVIIKIKENIKNKSIILCLAGHLVFPDEHVFKQINDTDWYLKMSGLPIIERYFESKDYIDYSRLNLTQYPQNPDLISVEEFMSDKVMEKYITHEQSFIIILDTPNLIRNPLHVRHSKLPGVFTTYEEPNSLLFVGRGRTAEYWKVYEDGYWDMTVVNSYLPNRTFDSVNEKHRFFNAGTDTPYRLYYDSRAFLLHLGVDVPIKDKYYSVNKPKTLHLGGKIISAYIPRSLSLSGKVRNNYSLQLIPEVKYNKPTEMNLTGKVKDNP